MTKSKTTPINLVMGKAKRSYLSISVGSEPKLSLAWFWLELLGKKAWLCSAHHAFQKARLGSARHILQKKLGSARLALSFKKQSSLEKQKMS